MPFAVPKETYNGKINTVTIGKDGNTVSFGGATSYPFLQFEGQLSARIPIALEVWDVAPTDWAPTLNEVYGEVYGNPAEWALACQDKYQADMIALRLASTHPDQGNGSPQEAAQVVKQVLEAIKLPLIILGSNHIEKDAEVLKACAEAAAGYNCLIGKAQEKNYKTIAAAAMAYGHFVLALSNLDINLAKQLNILLTQMGVKEERIVMDTMSSSLGYGLEYSYSVMERVRMAALKQNDTMVQMPIISDVGIEAWKAKEAKVDETAWGDTKMRGILWETTTAVALLMSGSDALIMRHPEAVEQVRKTIANLGMAESL
jgi:acetyl-CoA decarbonylase/synthase complex subunit delta